METKIGIYEIHELCMYFPWMEPETALILKEDIKKYGIRDKIKLFEGKILDGKNRMRALIELHYEVEPFIEELPEDTNIVAYAKSTNLTRRDLTTAQRVEIAEKLEEYRQKQNGTYEQNQELKKDPIQKKVIEDNEIKRIVKDAATTPEKVKQIREIKEKAKEDPKIQKEFDNLKSNKTKTIEKLHAKVVKKEKPKSIKKAPKVPTLQEQYIELRQKHDELKQRYDDLLDRYTLIEQECQTRGIWDDIWSSIVEKHKGKTPDIHTEELKDIDGIKISDKRKAELI